MPGLPSRARVMVSRALPPPVRRARRFYRRHGRLPALAEPRRFTDKVNWRILFDRRPLLVRSCDKLAMKDDVGRIAPRGVRVPELYWSGTDVRELSDVHLPPHWVLKPNNASGLVVLGSGRPDVEELAERTRGWADQRYWRLSDEWAYRCARNGLLVEELVGSPSQACPDLKVLVFDGVPRVVSVHTGRRGHLRLRYYTPDWTPLAWHGHYERGPDAPPPTRLPELLEASSVLAAGYDMLRVDFYEHDGELWFGELTPYPGAGMSCYEPELDELMGGWWTLPDLDPPPLLRAVRAIDRLQGLSRPSRRHRAVG